MSVYSIWIKILLLDPILSSIFVLEKFMGSLTQWIIHSHNSPKSQFFSFLSGKKYANLPIHLQSLRNYIFILVRVSSFGFVGTISICHTHFRPKYPLWQFREQCFPPRELFKVPTHSFSRRVCFFFLEECVYENDDIAHKSHRKWYHFHVGIRNFKREITLCLCDNDKEVWKVS